MELENIHNLAKLARLRRPKITCSPSYEDYRPKTNAIVLLNMGQTVRETMHRRKRERKGN
jgi:hypothetical protein